MGFQFSDFLLSLLRVSVLFSELADLSDITATLDLSKLKFPSNFSNACHFGTKSLLTNHPTFLFHHLTESRHLIDLDFLKIKII